MSTMGGHQVETDFPPSMGATMVEPETVDGLGVMYVDAPPTKEERERAEADKRRAVELAGVRLTRETLTHAKAQPLVAVTLVDVVHVKPNPAMSLRDAATILADCAGTIRPGDNGTIRYQLPERLHPDPLTHEAVRAQALEAVVTLDACRPLVHALLKAKGEMPDAIPCVGGGIG